MQNHFLKNLNAGRGTRVVIDNIRRIEPCSDSSAFCWLDMSYHPMAGSGLEAKPWSWTNVYLYRRKSEGEAAGWECVVTDQEATVRGKATGEAYNI